MKTTAENITKAMHDSGFIIESLQEALKTATATEGIIILQLIEQATKLDQKISNLQMAISCD